MELLNIIVAVFTLLLMANINEAYIDQTEDPLATGSDVVRATIARLDHAFMFNQTRSSTFWNVEHSTFMRILAYVETRDGLDDETFSTQSISGIWRISRLNASFVISDSHLRDVPHFVTEISDALALGQSTFQNLKDSFFPDNVKNASNSVIIAKLHLHYIIAESGPNSSCSSLPTSDYTGEQMADFWVDCYRFDGGEGSRDKQFFLRRYEEYKSLSREECTITTDLAFVLDRSGSVGSENWETVKNYVGNVSDAIDEESAHHRVAIISYSNDARIDLNFTSDRVEISNSTKNVLFTGGSTNTADGLCNLVSLDWRQNVLGIAILLTDGLSNQIASGCGRDTNGSYDTLSALEVVHNMLAERSLSVAIFVVGVTHNVNEDELRAISYNGRFSPLSDFSNFEQLNSIRRTQTYHICYAASATADLNSAINITNFTTESNARYHYQINTNEGMTIRLCQMSGRVILYASFTIPNPNGALNDFILDAIFYHLNCTDIFVDPKKVPSVTSANSGRKKRQALSIEPILYVSIEGIAESSTFTLEATTGNTAQNVISCHSVPNPCGSSTAIVCTDNSLGYSCGCLSGYVYNTERATCYDINECVGFSNPCPESSVCTNTEGSFECTCFPGYIKTENTTKCIIENNTKLQLIVSVASGIAGGVILLLVVVAAIISIYVPLTANKSSRFHQKDNTSRPADPNLNFLGDSQTNLFSVDILY